MIRSRLVMWLVKGTVVITESLWSGGRSSWSNVEGRVTARWGKAGADGGTVRRAKEGGRSRVPTPHFITHHSAVPLPRHASPNSLSPISPLTHPSTY